MTDRKHPTLRDIRNKLIEGRGYEKDNNDTFSGLLVIPKSINEIEYNAFENVTGISEIQNLSNATVMLPRVVIKVTVRAKGDKKQKTAKVTLAGTGNYGGTKIVTFLIASKNTYGGISNRVSNCAN